VALLFLIVFIDLVGFGIIIPLLPFYAEVFQAEPHTVTLLMAIYSATQFVAAPVWGRLSDRLGRRPILIISLAGTALSYVWLGFAHSLAVLFLARAFGGLMAGNISAAFAYMADITTPANRAKGMGLVGAAFGLGFIAGPAIGGILAGPHPREADFELPAFAAAALSAVAFLLTVAFLKESLAPEVRARLAGRPIASHWRLFVETLRRPGIGGAIGLMFLSTFVFAGMESTFALWSERQFGWGPEQNGYLFAFVGLVGALIQGAGIGKLARRFGEVRLVILGAVALAAGLLLVPFAADVPRLVGAMLVLVLGFSLLTPSLNSLVSLQVGAEEQGAVLGVGRSASTLARVVGPAWAGLLFSAFGRDWPFYAGAAVMLAVAALGLRTAGAPGREPANRTTPPSP
jgi:DHA1 family tetracycline resistance protein-like MFS transporter